MKIPTKEYSIESFTNELLKVSIGAYQRLRVACFMTSFSKWHDPQKMINLEGIFRNYGVRIEKLGEIRRIKTKYFDRQQRTTKVAIFYSYLDPKSKLLLFFTDEKREAIEQTLGQIAETSTGIYYMFLSSSIFKDLTNKILEIRPFAKCTFFSAKYVPQLTRKAQVRPDIKKTIMYHGDDALDTLEEVQQYYGVYPTIMRYYIPDRGYYDISSNGIFSLWSEESLSESKKLLLSLSNIAIEHVLKSREIIESSKYELIPVKTEKKLFRVPRLTPWIIQFSREIEFADSKRLVEAMTNNGFSLFNEVRVKGSLRLNGMVIDDKKQTMFSVNADNKQLYVAPIGELHFDSFMRFFKTVLDNFDPNASVARFER